MPRDGSLGQQDELRPGGHLCQKVGDVIFLPVGAAVEFVVAVDVGLEDAHLGRPLNSELTFYTRYGDYLGRISEYLMLLCVLYYIAYRAKKKNHLVK